MDVGPGKDIVGELGIHGYTMVWHLKIITGELAKAIRNNTDIHFGLYYSLFDFFHPLYLEDQANNFTTQNYVNVSDQYHSEACLECFDALGGDVTSASRDS